MPVIRYLHFRRPNKAFSHGRSGGASSVGKKMKTLKLATCVTLTILHVANLVQAQHVPGPIPPQYYQAAPMVSAPHTMPVQMAGFAGQAPVQLASCTAGGCADPGCADPGCATGGCSSGACIGSGCSSCGLLGGLGIGQFGGGLAGGHSGFSGQHIGQQNGPFGSGGCCLPRWFDFSAEWLFWEREFSDSLALSSEGILGPTVLDMNQLEIEEVSGFRVTGAYLVAPATALEASYFGGFSWSSSAAVNSAGNLFSVFSEFGFNPLNGFPETDQAHRHRIDFSSELDSGELNLRHRWVSANCVVHSSVLVGARYLRLADDFIYNTQVDTANPYPNQLNYLLQTDNDLVGAQVGGDSMICFTPRFKLGGEAKAGLYGTRSKQATTANFIDNTGTGGIFQELERDTDVAFVGEAGISGIFKVTPRLSLKLGYQVLYVAGVAVAVDNFNTASPLPSGGQPSTRTALLDNDGDVFYHGANLGFEWTW